MHYIKEIIMRKWFPRVRQTVCGPRPLQPRTFRPTLESLEERSLLDAGMTGFTVTNLFANNSPAMMSTSMPSLNGMPPAAGNGMMEIPIDAFFQALDARLISLESALIAQMPQLDGMIQSFNAMVTMVESAMAGHPIDDLSGKV